MHSSLECPAVLWIIAEEETYFCAIAFSAWAASCVFYWPFGDANSKLSLYPPSLESKQIQVTSATSLPGLLLVSSLYKGLWLVRALFIFTADLGCIVKWTFISGGWETNLVSWSLSSICNIFCNKRPCVLSSACQVATPQRRAVMFTRDVLGFYSPNISRRTQHTNVLLNGRGEMVVCTVHSTLYNGHCTLVLCV